MLSRKLLALYQRAAFFGHRTLFIVAVEAALIMCAAISAFLLRQGVWPEKQKLFFGLGLLLGIRLLLLWHYNLLRGWWRYTGFNEVMDLAKATGWGTLAFVVAHKIAIQTIGPELRWPNSIYLIEAALTALFLGAARAASRFLAEKANRPSAKSKRLLLVGAGAGARTILQEMRSHESGYTVVGLVDDNPTKQGISFEGVKVEGSVDDLGEVATRLNADEIWISAPSATASQMNRIVGMAAGTNLPYKSLPRLRDLVGANNLLSQVREVRTTDLLGRDPVVADLIRVRDKIKGKRVMVTGAAGSIGSELCWQLLSYGPAELICVDQSETGIFYLELKQRERAMKVPVHYAVADIANVPRMQRLMLDHRVDIIFHAAAYKHVPVMETNVCEAVYNNVTALKSLLDTADACKVNSFVMISSDKAVNPTNVMGTTKRIGELIIASRPRTKMGCVAVRFGNVLGSNGSVVPLFQEQIRRDNEITITHPNIKRYFMTIDEAVSLVLQAFTVGEHGDVLVLDMGEPIRIVDLAKNLIRLSGRTESEVKIRYVGLRDGEKLKEELFYESEEVWPTACTKVMRTKSAVKSWGELSNLLKELEVAMSAGSSDELKMVMRSIVPEYTPAEMPVGKRSPESQEIREKRAAVAGGSTSIQ